MKKIVNSDGEMIGLGIQVARLIDGGSVIELVGDVGAGKTTFVKGLAKGLGVNEQIQSPTFTISRVYDCDTGLKLHHYDFYRLNNAGIMRDELIEVSSDLANVVVIEWSDLVKDAISESRILIKIKTISDNTREIEILSSNPKFDTGVIV